MNFHRATRAAAGAWAALLPKTVASTLAAVALVIAVPTVLAEARGVARELEERRQLELRAGLDLARATAVAFEVFLHDVSSELLVLGLALVRSSGEAVERAGLLAGAAVDYPTVADFAWYSPDGVRLETSAGPEGAPHPPPEIIAAAVRDGHAFGDLVRTEAGLAFFAARAVPGPDGEVRGVMVAVIRPVDLGRATLPHERAGGGGSVTLIDGTGRLVYTRPEMALSWDERMLLTPERRRVGYEIVATAMAGREATGTLLSVIDGRWRLAAVTPIAKTGWVAAATRREDVALADIRRSLAVRAVIFAAAIGCALLAAFFLARRISSPLLELARRAGGGAGAPRRRSGPRELREIRLLAASLARQRRQIAVRERRLAQARHDAESAAELAGREAALLDSMLESAPHAIVLYERGGTIARMNAAAGALLGYPDRERQPSAVAWGEIVRLRTPAGAQIPWSETPMARALAGEVVRGVELRLEPAAGPRRAAWVSVSAAPVRGAHGEVVHAVAMFVDVSQVKELEEQRDDLLRVVSHDLRTPLATILNQAHLVIHRPGDVEWVSARGRGIVVAVGRMNAMIQDLLDAARFERGQLTLERAPMDLSHFVAELLGRLEGALPVSRVRTHLAPDLGPVSADPNRLERIFANLLSNALKYSEGEVDLELRREGDEIVIAISDRGPGIDPAQLPELFERFSRAARGRAHGVGLGLYSTRVLVEAHGGRISVASEPGRGSTFTVVLPA